MSRIEDIRARLNNETSGGEREFLAHAPGDITHLLSELQRVRDLANLFTGEADPNYKDQWETGHDAGMATAGRQLGNLLDSIGVPK